MHTTPKITFKINKKGDIVRFTSFLNHPKYPSKRNSILIFYPKLSNLLGNYDNETLAVEYFVNDMYKRHLLKIKQIIKKSKKEIVQSEAAFTALSNIMNFSTLNYQSYTAIPTFLPFSPFTNKTFFFSIARLHLKSKRFILTAIHEISHFIFFKQLKKWEVKSGLKLIHPSLHYFKEALTAAILNQYEFRIFFNYEKMFNTKNYPGNFELHNLQIQTNGRPVNIVSFFEREIIRNNKVEYFNHLNKLLEFFAKNQRQFETKWNLWNKYLINQNPKNLLKAYKNPIKY